MKHQDLPCHPHYEYLKRLLLIPYEKVWSTKTCLAIRTLSGHKDAVMAVRYAAVFLLYWYNSTKSDAADEQWM